MKMHLGPGFSGGEKYISDPDFPEGRNISPTLIFGVRG